MLEKTRGIILHTVKYGDSGLILTVYTEQAGRMACITSLSAGKKSGNRAGIFQPLFIIELDIYQKKSRAVQRIREARVANPYTSLPFDIVKTTQAIFLSEILNKLLQEEETNPGLFHFLESSFLYFDLMEEGKSSFYLWFLIHLTGYLGILPDLANLPGGWFDIQKGTLVRDEPRHPLYMDLKMTELFRQVLELPLRELNLLHIGRPERTRLLKNLLDYYHHHFSTLSNLKSLEVLNEVFH